MSPDDIRPGLQVIATDAFGQDHPGVVTRGPVAPRGKGSFWKAFVRINDDEIPWPVESLRTGQEITP
jgi:hypothetical protein